MKIIFFLPSGVIEYPIPEALREHFNFNAVASTTRINGFFLSDTLYMKHDSFIGMAFQADDAAPVAPVRRDLN